MGSFLFHTQKSRYFVAPQLRCSLIFSLYARVKPNASFAVAWFPSSLQKSLLKVSLQKANKRVTTSVLFRAHTRNLSKYRSFRYSSAITGGTCRSLTVSDCCSHGSVRLSEAMFDLPLLLPSQPAKPEWFSGVFSVNSHMQMYSLRHCVLFLCTGFMLTHLHQFVNRKKARRTGIFSYSPHSADLSFIVTIICGLL